MSRSIEEQEREAVIEREERMTSALERIADALERRGAAAGPKAVGADVLTESLRIDLDNGVQVLVPLEWFPSLVRASWPERSNCKLLGGGEGIHWPDIDEDLSVAGILERALKGTR